MRHEAFQYENSQLTYVDLPITGACAAWVLRVHAGVCAVLAGCVTSEKAPFQTQPQPIPSPPHPPTLHSTTEHYPYLLVNIGSGVSMVRVDGESKFTRVSGTNIGGGTFWGLCKLLTGMDNFDDILALSSQGDNSNVDMLVGDIYGGRDYTGIGLSGGCLPAAASAAADDADGDAAAADGGVEVLRLLLQQAGAPQAPACRLTSTDTHTRYPRRRRPLLCRRRVQPTRLPAALARSSTRSRGWRATTPPTWPCRCAA